jgi:hypothetical protein
MEARETRRVELLVPVRTILVVAGAIVIMTAFMAIGSRRPGTA